MTGTIVPAGGCISPFYKSSVTLLTRGTRSPLSISGGCDQCLRRANTSYCGALLQVHLHEQKSSVMSLQTMKAMQRWTISTQLLRPRYARKSSTERRRPVRNPPYSQTKTAAYSWPSVADSGGSYLSCLNRKLSSNEYGIVLLRCHIRI